VFVDTGSYFALAVREDTHHHRARDLLRSLEQRGGRLFTSNFILTEMHALLLSRRGRDLAARTLERIDRSSALIVRIGPDDEQRARAIIYEYDDKNFSLTDATSFAVMERLRISTAFTFGRNFAQYGFQLLGV